MEISRTSLNFAQEFLDSFLAPETKRAYIQDLKDFIEFAQNCQTPIHKIQDIKAPLFIAYRDKLMQNSLAPASVHRKLVSIRSLVKWAMANKLLDHNPLDSVKLPKNMTQSPTLAFDDADVVEMIKAPDITTAKGRTHRLILVLLFHLGLRRSELTHIKLKDILEERGHLILKIKGKGEKIRLLPLTTQVQEEIAQYLDQTHSLSPDDYLLQLSNQIQEKPINGSTIYRIVTKYSQQIGLFKRVGPHSCRATVISHLLDTQKIPVRDVAHFAGHSQISTTERYDKKRKGLNDNAAYNVAYKK